MVNSTTGRRSSQRFQKMVTWVGDFFSHYWAHIIMTTIGLLLLAAILAPILAYFGLDSIARPIFFSMHVFCAQTPSHSFYIGGHQMCLCERCTAIYSSMFMGCLVFLLTKKHWKGIPWWMWIIFCLPMALDGGTQMFGLRESTWALRLLTGSIFGYGLMWFALPLMQKSLNEATASVSPYVTQKFPDHKHLPLHP